MKTLTDIDQLLNWLREHAPQAKLTTDSRSVAVGDVFFALTVPGGRGDGRDFISNAIERGAAAVVFAAEGSSVSALSVPAIGFKNLHQQLGEIGNAWYNNIQADMFNVAITGTNGKTSCSQWIARALSLTGTSCSVVGTLGVGTYREGTLSALHETGFTTPDALQLQERLADSYARGARALAIEASSIGLHQGRLSGLHFDVAVFTNLTRDHLDYHGTMEAYAAAKAQLFAWPGLQTAVINIDDEFGLKLVQQIQEQASSTKILAYTLDSELSVNADVLRASQLRSTHAGTSFFAESPYGQGIVKTQLIGRFNVSNTLATLGVLLARGVEWDKAVSVIEKLSSVQGRMQQLGTPGQAMVVVDYAHTPDALQKTLETLQEVAQERHGELWCVFGCGGDRDPGKRPQMGKISQLAQHVVVTSDNPRTEDAAKIILDIIGGMDGTPTTIEDRASAILYAVKHAGVNDVILIAGKGHETYQDINGKKWPFSDEEHARLALATVATNNTMRRSS